MLGPPLRLRPVRPPAEVMLNRAAVSPVTMALIKRRRRAPDTLLLQGTAAPRGDRGRAVQPRPLKQFRRKPGAAFDQIVRTSLSMSSRSSNLELRACPICGIDGEPGIRYFRQSKERRRSVDIVLTVLATLAVFGLVVRFFFWL